MPRQILVLYAHPSPSISRANRALRAAIDGLDGVKVHDLYETYPDFFVDVAREQALLAAHDVLVVQHPFYWYSCPALVREWMDVVLAHGWAYGAGGTALRGKAWLQAVTTSGPAERYRHDGLNRYTVPELLRPFEQSALLCNMTYLEPFVAYATPGLDDAALAVEAARYRERIERLARGDELAPFDTFPEE